MEVATLIYNLQPFLFVPIVGVILIFMVALDMRRVRKLPKIPTKTQFVLPIELERRQKKDAKLAKYMQGIALLFLVAYGGFVYQGLLASPVPEQISDLYGKFVQITEYLKSGAEVESQLTTLDMALEQAEKLSQCTSETCADENRAMLVPLLSYLTEDAKRAYEEEVRTNSTGANSTQDLYLGLSLIQKHIKNYNPKEHTTNVSKIVQGVVFSLIHKYVPEGVEIGEEFNRTSFHSVRDAVRKGVQLAHNVTLAEEKFRALWNDMEHLTLALGVNKFVDSWRHDLENWGLSTDSSLLLIGLFGPDLPGQMTFTNCIVRDYVDSAFTPEKIITEDGLVVQGPLKWNGLTIFQFALQVLFGRGICYLFFQLKVVFLSCLMAYFSAGYGILVKLLNAACHQYEKVEGGFDSWGYLFYRCPYLFIRSFRVISFWLASTFLITTTMGVCTSFILELGYVTVAWCLAAYLVLHILARIEKGPLTKEISHVALFFVMFCLLVNLSANAAQYSLGQISPRDYLPIPSVQYIWAWAIDFARVHVKTYSWILVFQFGVFILFVWISSNRKWYKDSIENSPSFRVQREGVKLDRPEWMKTEKRYRFWTVVNWIIYGFGWAQPVLAILIKTIAPTLGITFFQELPHIGYLSFGDGGINYIWSLLDMATLPTNQFKITY